jgi:hypothetical protein
VSSTQSDSRHESASRMSFAKDLGDSCDLQAFVRRHFRNETHPNDVRLAVTA